MTLSGNHLYSSVGTEWWPHRSTEETSVTCLWGQGYYLVYLYSIPQICGSCLNLAQHGICDKGLDSGAANSSYGEIQLRSPSCTGYSGNVHNLGGFGSPSGHLRNESQEKLLRLSFPLKQPVDVCRNRTTPVNNWKYFWLASQGPPTPNWTVFRSDRVVHS